jgi:hypothetical protein
MTTLRPTPSLNGANAVLPIAPTKKKAIMVIAFLITPSRRSRFYTE